ncbi:hypothetical protein JTE90_006768 [Oedothorax gibbosus]|uniref:DNA-directed DNA polymerase n=1 Tax=Oedothorax gibbosus TaxID=931172 RepID=A0AAV6UIW4_9ARAC|nr:hypothetical protein JTE90_006768 [Oedothorax gibbosus]
MPKRKFEELDDADEPRSEVSVLFEEESLGITEEEAWLYDDDDELFMENPLPEQIGDGIAPPDVNQMDTGVKASGFWDRIPVVGPVSLDRAIILQERSRRVIRRYDGEETTYFALIDPSMLPESAQDSTLGNSIEVVRMLFERLLVQTTRNLSPHDLIRIILEDDTKVLTDNTKTVEDIFFPNDDICGLQWRQEEGFLPQDITTNISLAAFTTCHARLKLYSELFKLDRSVLYFDTDSIIYASNGHNDPPLGNYLGEFTDELGGETIQKFVSGGPKNYAYVTSSGKTVCKIRGFTLNYRNSLSLNFDAVVGLVSSLDQETGIPITYSTIARDAKKRKVPEKNHLFLLRE